MKKVFFIMLLSLAPLMGFAQDQSNAAPTDQGRILVNGTIEASWRKSEMGNGPGAGEVSFFNAAIRSKVGYFIADRLAVGIEFGATYSEETTEDNARFDLDSFTIEGGPFARYYLTQGLFAQGGLGFGTATSNSGFSDYNADYFGYGLGLGYAWFLNSSVSVEPVLSYRYARLTDESDFKTTTTGIFLGVGFAIYL